MTELLENREKTLHDYTGRCTAEHGDHPGGSKKEIDVSQDGGRLFRPTPSFSVSGRKG